MSIELASAEDPLRGYYVECPSCGEEFSVQGGYPEYCVYCGENLEDQGE